MEVVYVCVFITEWVCKVSSLLNPLMLGELEHHLLLPGRR